MNSFVLKKLRHRYIWKRIFFERGTEPIHLNLLSLFVGLFGSFRTKIEFDMIPRQPYAFALQKCADAALRYGLPGITVVEFGVAAGGGLLNLCYIAQKISQKTGVRFRIVGFDSGQGMPAPKDYRDHPDLYRKGDFPMFKESLKKSLPKNAELILGDVSATVPPFLATLSSDFPLGFVSLDLDYYSSTITALSILKSDDPSVYLPLSLVYVDDLEDEHHNTRCGEQLAISEFNEQNSLRVVERHKFLCSYRLFQRARWINHMFYAHILDHPLRQHGREDAGQTILENCYLADSPKYTEG